MSVFCQDLSEPSSMCPSNRKSKVKTMPTPSLNGGKGSRLEKKTSSIPHFQHENGSYSYLQRKLPLNNRQGEAKESVQWNSHQVP